MHGYSESPLAVEGAPCLQHAGQPARWIDCNESVPE